MNLEAYFEFFWQYNLEDKKQTRILLVNDMAGYGKVALSVMIPVLSHLKFETFNLPTALVSNTLDYGQFDILDTTEYMEIRLQVKNKSLSFAASVLDLLCQKNNHVSYMNIAKNNKNQVLRFLLTLLWGMTENDTMV